VTGAVGWRKDNLRYKKNEVFLDIVEQVCPRKEKKTLDCAFQHQFNEKPSIIPGCPGGMSSKQQSSWHAQKHLVVVWQHAYT